MELFLAQNHSAMTHIPIAASILTAVAAVTALVVRRREVVLFWAVLALVALVSAFPTVVTGIAAARGRTNEGGKAYIQRGVLVDRTLQNTRIFRHQMLAIAGTAFSALLAASAIAALRGRRPNPYAVALLAVLVSVLWGIGGHLGGKELWGPDTFPAWRPAQSLLVSASQEPGLKPSR